MNHLNETLLEAMFDAKDPLADKSISTVYWWQFFRAKARSLLKQDATLYYREIRYSEVSADAETAGFTLFDNVAKVRLPRELAVGLLFPYTGQAGMFTHTTRAFFFLTLYIQPMPPQQIQKSYWKSTDT